MADDKVKQQPETQPDEEQDVEGHSMFLDPNLARDMARSRNREIEREAKERNRAKEAKG